MVTTVGPTSMGWQILKQEAMPYKDSDGDPWLPFIKIKFKTSPLPNRAYDVGAIEPTIKIQRAFNDLMNEYFDNVSLINNKQWIVRRGAEISPIDLVRKPGGMIKVDDINADIKAEEVGDIKGSLIEMLERLDNEFQQSSMIVNLLKAVPSGTTATEAALAQSNTQTVMELIDNNIKEGMSELGMRLLQLNQQFMKGKQSLKILEDDKRFVFANFDPKAIKGKYSVRISADRTTSYSKVIKQKQLLDLLALIGSDPNIMQKYPKLTSKISRKWLEEGGYGDIDFFFAGEQGQIQPQEGQATMPGDVRKSAQQPGPANRGENLTEGAVSASASAGSQVQKEV